VRPKDNLREGQAGLGLLGTVAGDHSYSKDLAGRLIDGLAHAGEFFV